MLGLDEAAAFFGVPQTGASTFTSGTGEIFTPYQDKDIPSWATRGYRSYRDKPGACRRGRLEVIGS